jgi:very-short-patch-repair endonuclease
MRREPTRAEHKFWQHLRTLRPRFTRQLVISHDIADFACRSLKVIIKLDGGQHATLATDAERTR